MAGFTDADYKLIIYKSEIENAFCSNPVSLYRQDHFLSPANKQVDISV